MNDIMTIEAPANESGYVPFYHGSSSCFWREDGKAMTIQEALVASDLDFEVEKLPGGAFVSIGNPETGKSTPKFIKAKDMFYTMRMDTHDILGKVGRGYCVLQNKDAFTFCSDIVDSGEASIVAAGNVKNGAKTFVVAQIMGSDMAIDGFNESLNPFLTLVNDHQGSGSVTGFISLTRPICNNMLRYLIKDAPNVFRVRHTKTMHDRLTITSGREALAISVRYSAEFEKQVAALLAQKVDVPAVDRFINALLPIPEQKVTTMTRADGEVVPMANRGVKVAEDTQEAILDIYQSADNLNDIRGTAYGLLNAVSEYAQHHIEGRVTREGDEDRVKAENRFLRLHSEQGIDHRAWNLLTSS